MYLALLVGKRIGIWKVKDDISAAPTNTTVTDKEIGEIGKEGAANKKRHAEPLKYSALGKSA